MSLLLIRHGETAFNRDRVMQPADTPLSEQGVAQARHLAGRLGCQARCHSSLCKEKEEGAA